LARQEITSKSSVKQYSASISTLLFRFRLSQFAGENIDSTRGARQVHNWIDVDWKSKNGKVEFMIEEVSAGTGKVELCI
jgi:hypothetical protein